MKNGFEWIVCIHSLEKKGILRETSAHVAGSNPRGPTTKVKEQLLAFSEN
jgi:hypothetical protein